MRRFWNLATSIIFIIFCISVIGYLQIPITSRKSQAISKEEAIKQEKRLSNSYFPQEFTQFWF